MITHLLEQRDNVTALVSAAWAARKKGGGGAHTKVALPGPTFARDVRGPSDALVRDYLRCVGGDPSAYRGVLPPHLFPQWAFPLAAQALDGLPFPLTRIVNLGCGLTAHAPIPSGQTLRVSAELVGFDDDGARVIASVRVVTGTRDVPVCLESIMRTYIPLSKDKSKKGARDPEVVPADAVELSRQRIRSDAGRQFAWVTGDVNPIHWVPAYARAAGFRGVILHGFGTLARAFEGLVRARVGRPERLRRFDVRFARPLLLPGDVGLYTQGHRVFVADGKLTRPYLTGEFETHE